MKLSLSTPKTQMFSYCLLLFLPRLAPSSSRGVARKLGQDSLISTKLAAAIGEDVCKALIGLHAFTGCDTVSAFAGKGKAKAFKLLKSEDYVRVAFNQLGQTWELPQDLFTELEKFTCQLYSSGTNKVNEARYNLFCSKNGELESHQLAPCQDCLRKHTLRANY